MKSFHERFCSKTLSPCRCEFDNDEDFEKYGELFVRVEVPAKELWFSRVRGHARIQQQTKFEQVLALFGWPCEFGKNCAWPGLGFRCGHRRAGFRK